MAGRMRHAGGGRAVTSSQCSRCERNPYVLCTALSIGLKMMDRCGTSRVGAELCVVTCG